MMIRNVFCEAFLMGDYLGATKCSYSVDFRGKVWKGLKSSFLKSVPQVTMIHCIKYSTIQMCNPTKIIKFNKIKTTCTVRETSLTCLVVSNFVFERLQDEKRKLEIGQLLTSKTC